MPLKDVLGVEELSPGLGKCLIAEICGTFLINYFGCLSTINLTDDDNSSNFILIALTFGFIVAVAVQTLGHLSGAHINPAVTVGFLAAGKISLIKSGLYIIAQCLGCIAGSAVMKVLTPEKYHTGLGNTGLNENLTAMQGLGVEFFLGFLLVLVVFGVCDPNKPEAKPVAPLMIGLTVAAGHMAVIDYTGSSMNPARSLGSAIVTNSWSSHWIYWVGPCFGAIAAALLYTHFLSAPAADEYSTVSGQNNVTLKRIDGKSEAGQA